MTRINPLQVASIPVFNAQVPSEGPMCVSLRLDFTATTEFDLDGKQLTDAGYLSLLQTLFIDSTGANANITVNIAGTNQNITVKPNTQGYYPIICPNPFRLVFTCANGPSNVLILLLNMPIAPGQWATV